MSTEALKPSAILRAAADLIEPEGRWTQGSYWRSAPEGASHLHVDRFIRKVLPAVGTEYTHEWNDAPGRTQAEVVAKLRAAAALAEAEGQ